MVVRIVTDSLSYIPADLRAQYDIVQVPVYVHEDGGEVLETAIDSAAFFKRLASTSQLPTTSQASPEDFRHVFADALADGWDVLAVLISGSMSGMVSSADAAARMLGEHAPEARIKVLDSRVNCMQEGFAVLAAAKAAQSGGSLPECEQAALDSMLRSRFLFTPRSLEYLRRGGRISAAASLLGSALRIVPVLTAEAGETAVAGRARSQTAAMREIARLMRVDVERCGLRQAVVQWIADEATGVEFGRTYIEPIVGGPVQVIPIGPGVGVHVGPAVGVVYETIEPLR